MMERTPFTEDSKKEALDAQIKADKELVLTAKVDLREMATSLCDFMSRIEDEKPEAVVFMDKGARIFAGPFAKALKERMANTPKILFFNDAKMKKLFTDAPEMNKADFQSVAQTNFPELRNLENKKVFFFDEIYAYGLGAAIIEKLSPKQGTWSYFALSSYVGRRAIYEADIEREIQTNIENMKKENRFLVYPHDRRNVFSSEAAKLYVAEQHGVTTVSQKFQMTDSPYVTLPGASAKIPNAFWSPDEEERELFSSSQDALRKEKMETVLKLKDMIYETLKKSG